jgi:hypothetical protein
MRGIWIALLGVVACAAAGPAYAQHEHQESPYVGMEHSEIPSLSAQEVEDLRSAAGMGFARAAELNHYPGPRHVLELEEAMRLTDEQRSEILEIQSVMRDRALELGEAIIDAERDLNVRFEGGQIRDEVLAAATREIGLLYGELRYTHLRAHLATRGVLEEDQITEYDRLRGYARSGH